MSKRSLTYSTHCAKK